MKVNVVSTEALLLDLDFKIKQTLQLTSANPDTCFTLLEELKALTVTPLILKKNPHCVETMKRLRRYVGNTRNWQFTEEQKLQFNEKADKLRKISIEIYNNFKVSFNDFEISIIIDVFYCAELVCRTREHAVLRLLHGTGGNFPDSHTEFDAC